MGVSLAWMALKSFFDFLGWKLRFVTFLIAGYGICYDDLLRFHVDCQSSDWVSDNSIDDRSAPHPQSAGADSWIKFEFDSRFVILVSSFVLQRIRTLLTWRVERTGLSDLERTKLKLLKPVQSRETKSNLEPEWKIHRQHVAVGNRFPFSFSAIRINLFEWFRLKILPQYITLMKGAEMSEAHPKRIPFLLKLSLTGGHTVERK